jgi:plastocyanin
VTGTVAYAGKAPAKVLIDTSMDPACSLNGEKVYTEQVVADGGKLANVFVYVKSGPAAAMNAADGSSNPGAPKPVVLDQKGCQYVPHVIGVMAGGTVEFRNSDPTMHNIHTMPTEVGNEAIDVSQGPKGAPKDKVFQKPELMIPVRCNNHPWMNAFINVSATPFFAVTGADGSFALRGLPPGDYVLGAVQEKLGEQTLKVTVAANGTATAGFSFPAK